MSCLLLPLLLLWTAPSATVGFAVPTGGTNCVRWICPAASGSRLSSSLGRGGEVSPSSQSPRTCGAEWDRRRRQRRAPSSASRHAKRGDGEDGSDRDGGGGETVVGTASRNGGSERSMMRSGKATTASPPPSSPLDDLLALLHEYGYSQRVVHLSFPTSSAPSSRRGSHPSDDDDDGDDDDAASTGNSRPPVYLAEFQDQGRTRLCRIVDAVFDDEDDDGEQDDENTATRGDGPCWSHRHAAPTLEIDVAFFGGWEHTGGQGLCEDQRMGGSRGTTRRVVDVGQITTIWDPNIIAGIDDADATGVLAAAAAAAADQAMEPSTTRTSSSVDSIASSLFFDAHHHHANVEETLEGLYRSRVGRGRGSGVDDNDFDDERYQSGSTTELLLAKKQIAKLARAVVVSGSSGTAAGNNKERQLQQQQQQQDEQEHIERILRQLIKTGARYARLVDSAILRDALAFGSSEGREEQPHNQQQLQQQLQQQRQFAAEVLGDEAFTVGRFKRMPCLWLGNSRVGSSSGYNATVTTTATTEEDSKVISFVNGGWLVVDQSVRASTEGRNFAATAAAAATAASATTTTAATSGPDASAAKPTMSQLAAIERITHRLECLAMGEEPSLSAVPSSATVLERDVRAALQAMDLPLSPDGARQALLRAGIWSEVQGSRTRDVSPWSTSVLTAANWYVAMDQERRRALYDVVRSNKKQGDQNNGETGHPGNNPLLEGRIDLTHLPCVCVDTARAKFRDDAIGIRPRASTGRQVNDKASKWEILLHIADVSDIYAPEPSPLVNGPGSESSVDRANLQILEKAAASRGTSRYDLPLGPLHMLPPNVLESLALHTVKPGISANHVNKETVNRCFTVWVYIDEQSGKVIDAGVERTLVSRPLALSFRDATDLLDGSMQEHDREDVMAKARAIITVAERNIQRWSDYRRTTSDNALAREERMAAYEEISKQVNGKRGIDPNDDGSSGFQRSRGHRLVDSAMDLYGYSINGLMRRSLAPLPRVAGTRSGRVATGPLRRYVDAAAQRQALAVLCDYGGHPLTKQECIEVGRRATEALNKITNVDVSTYSSRNNAGVGSRSGNSISKSKQDAAQQQSAIRMLKMKMKTINSGAVPAMTTGKGNEVLIMGAGALATCRGMRGTLRPGEEIMVKIEHIDDQNGKIFAVLDESQP